METSDEPLTMLIRSTARPVQVSKNIKNIEIYIDKINVKKLEIFDKSCKGAKVTDGKQ